MFVMPCAIVALSLLYLSFLCFSLMARTRSRPYGLCHCLGTSAHIKGFGSPYLHVYACFLLCFMLVIAFLVLGFAIVDALRGYVVVWSCPTPMRPYLDVSTWDASSWCQLLRAYLFPFPHRAMICLPYLSVPLVGFIRIFTCLFRCPYMSLAC